MQGNTRWWVKIVVSAYDLLMVNKMSSIEITSVSVPYKIKIEDSDEVIEIQFTLTGLEGLSREEIELKILEFITGSTETVEKMSEGMEKPAVKSPPVITWDEEAIKRTASLAKCKKCGGLVSYKRGISPKNGKPYIGFFCKDSNCKTAHWLEEMLWSHVKNGREILDHYPHWHISRYAPLFHEQDKPVIFQEGTRDLSVEEVAAITEKSVDEIQDQVDTKMKKLKMIVSKEAAIKLVAKDLGAIKT